MLSILKYIGGDSVVGIILDCYFVFIIILAIVGIVIRNRKVFSCVFFFLFIIIIYYVAVFLDLKASTYIYEYILKNTPFFLVLILAPEIRQFLEGTLKFDKEKVFVSSNDKSKRDIVDAVEYLASKKIGAIITIEKFNSLDQYAERAIQMNCDISKELLINIFSPLTPLHDGAVIIRGNKIRCAGAYYVLTEADTSDKTMGSRHRAALGISEVTDSLTIVCSEETGKISITIEGIMLKVNDKQKLLDYIDLFMN